MNRSTTLTMDGAGCREQWWAGLAGHAWTVAPAIRDYLLPGDALPEQPFSATVDDPLFGPVRLRGILHEVAGADTLVLVVHGLAGSAASAYCARAARAAVAAGLSSLRLSLRGADLSGEDISHGGLTDDLWAALASPQMARYRAVVIVGYSAGGHMALRAGVERRDPRLRAVAAICPPLDLTVATEAIDAPCRRLYKRHIFAGLDAIYEATAARRRLPVPPAIVRRARSSRERDELTVVPRFGFASAADYYARESAAACIERLDIPGVVVASRADPIVPAETLTRALSRASAALTVRWVDHGGHVHFPADLDLGFGGPAGLERQVVGWLARGVDGAGARWTQAKRSPSLIERWLRAVALPDSA